MPIVLGCERKRQDGHRMEVGVFQSLPQITKEQERFSLDKALLEDLKAVRNFCALGTNLLVKRNKKIPGRGEGVVVVGESYGKPQIRLYLSICFKVERAFSFILEVLASVRTQTFRGGKGWLRGTLQPQDSMIPLPSSRDCDLYAPNTGRWRTEP